MNVNLKRTTPNRKKREGSSTLILYSFYIHVTKKATKVRKRNENFVDEKQIHQNFPIVIMGSMLCSQRLM